MPRVPKGMFKREGRGWYCRVYAGGQERWVALGSDLSEAVRKFHEARTGPVPSKATVAQLSQEWLVTYCSTARNGYNQGQSASRVKRYLVEFLGPLVVSKVGPEDLRRYRLWLEKHDLSATSVKHVLSDARCFLNWAEDAGYIDRSPFPKRLMPRLQERPPDRLTDEEVEAVASIADPHGFVVRLALGTGLRWGELTRISSTDIQDGVLVVHQTKSTKLRRVPLPPDLLVELKTHVGKLNPFPVSDHFNRAVRLRSGVERFHVHQCRHSYACRWLERGGSLAALQQILGHSTIVTTQRYGRIADDLVKAEAARVYTVATTVASAVRPKREVESAQ